MDYTGERNSKGKRHGQGIYSHHRDGTYRGEWKDGKRHGQGTITFTDGSTYTGDWKDGKLVP